MGGWVDVWVYLSEGFAVGLDVVSTPEREGDSLGVLPAVVVLWRWVGGWVGGWKRKLSHWIEENEAGRMSYCKDGWVGGWVGGWVYLEAFHELVDNRGGAVYSSSRGDRLGVEGVHVLAGGEDLFGVGGWMGGWEGRGDPRRFE